MKRTMRLFARFLSAIAVITAVSLHSQDLAARDQTIVFLVRHAEKMDESEDPPLSPAGVARAQSLAGLLADAGLDGIWSTDYRRTRDTAAPLAERLDITVRSYDPESLKSLADGIKRRGGRHLVVGHSNTTIELVRLLGGEPGSDIDEGTEYDRLYILTLDRKNKATTVLLRYGASNPPPQSP